MGSQHEQSFSAETTERSGIHSEELIIIDYVADNRRTAAFRGILLSWVHDLNIKAVHILAAPIYSYVTAFKFYTRRKSVTVS